MKRHGKYYFLHIRWVLRAERLFRYDQMFDWASDCSGFLIRPRTKQATSIHPLQNRWLYVSCWKNFCFCSADSDVDFIFIFMKNPFWFFWSVDPFFFSPISFAHHADKSECLRLQFFLFWVNHVQHVHTDERSNLRSIFLLAASNSLNWVWPARKSFANTSF